MTDNIWRLCTCRLVVLLIPLLTFIPSRDAVYNYGSIKCTDTLGKLGLQRNDETVVRCPESCLEGYCKVVGSGPYTMASYICCAAIHNGTLPDDEGGEIKIELKRKLIPHFFGSRRHGLKSKNDFQQSTVSFITKRIHATLKSMSPTTGSTLTSTPDHTPRSSSSKIVATETDDLTSAPVKTEVLRGNTAKDEEKLEQTSENQGRHETTPSPPYSPIHNNLLYNSTTLVSDRKPTTVTMTTTEDKTNSNLLTLQSHFFALTVIFTFVCGLLCAFGCAYCRRKAKKAKDIRPRTTGSTSRRQNSRSVCEEGDICVCYENLSSSKQGLLLYDPETCDRPCPIRNPQESNSFLDDVTMTKSASLERSFNRTDKGKCGIRYEEECAEKCTGACNPGQFDF